MDAYRSHILSLLRSTFEGGRIGSGSVHELQSVIWNNIPEESEHPADEILRDLAYDLDYYQPDTRLADGDLMLFGDDKALRLIDDAFKRILALED